MKVPNVIPGGSYAVRLRQRLQGHRVDLYVTIWGKNEDFVIRAIAAEDQPDNMIRPRNVLSGKRAGHVVSDIRLCSLDPDVFPILAQRKGHNWSLRYVPRSAREFEADLWENCVRKVVEKSMDDAIVGTTVTSRQLFAHGASPETVVAESADGCPTTDILKGVPSGTKRHSPYLAVRDARRIT
jgi:hypothetical protein